MRKISMAIVAICVFSSAFAATDRQLAADARIAMRNGDNEQASKMLEQAIAMNPKVGEYHYLLGGAYGNLAQNAGMFSAMGLAKKTKAEFELAVQLDPTNVDFRLGLIDFYSMAPGIAGGSMDKALEQAAALKKVDLLEGHRAYGRIYNRQKKTDLARKEYVDAVREQPNSPKAHLFLGAFYVTQKEWASALHEFDYALKLDANYMPAYFRIGHLAATSEANYARGEEALRKYLGYTPKEDEPTIASTWYYLGKIQELQGKKADAKQSYTNALKILPKSKDIAEALKRVS